MVENIKKVLDNLVVKYETPDFIDNDPVRFPHMFEDQHNIEISGLIASSLAYGKREKIIESVEKIHKIMNYSPYKFCRNFDFDRDSSLFEGFIHRYTSGIDVALLIGCISQALKEYNTLEEIFLQEYSKQDINVKPALTYFVKTLRGYTPPGIENLRGLYHLIPSPEKGSACKRLNLFIKWMVRPGPVDLNVWKEVGTDKLIIPLDTHVAKISRKLGLTDRKADDWKAAEEITENLKKFDNQDPVKYDFAIFGVGVNKETQKYLGL